MVELRHRAIDIHGNISEIVPGKPLRRGVKCKMGSQT